MKNMLVSTTCAVALSCMATAAFAQSGQVKQPAGSGAVQSQTDVQAPAAGSSSVDAGAKAGEKGSVEAEADGTAKTQAGNKSKTGVSAESDANSEVQTKDDKNAEGAAEGDTATGKEAKQDGDADQRADKGKKSGEAPRELNAEAKQEFSRIIVEKNVTRVNLDVDISVGTAIRQRVEVYPLPPRVITLYPAYEGYVYFVLADGRIVIVEPDTFVVISVIVA